jgi:hypothetical protein
LLVIPAKAESILLVIPPQAGLSTAELVVRLFLGFDSQCKASTPPAEERVTSFFARAKKKVTKKESTLHGAPGLTHAGSESLRRWHLRVRRRSVQA